MIIYLFKMTENLNDPFSKNKVLPLEYDTDDESHEEYLRICFSWDYQINYDYYKFNYINIYSNKTIDFYNNLKEIKKDRLGKLRNGEIIKFQNNLDINKDIYVYLIVYYDNTKINIEFYCVTDQLLDEDILIKNIQIENIYGRVGVFDYNNIYNDLDQCDFLILCIKTKII